MVGDDCKGWATFVLEEVAHAGSAGEDELRDVLDDLGLVLGRQGGEPFGKAHLALPGEQDQVAVGCIVLVRGLCRGRIGGGGCRGGGWAALLDSHGGSDAAFLTSPAGRGKRIRKSTPKPGDSAKRSPSEEQLWWSGGLLGGDCCWQEKKVGL